VLNRSYYVKEIQKALKRSRIVALTGPRQCGKTTLARQLISEKSANYFDLEDPVSLARMHEPMYELSRLKGLIVIDEIQRKPDLFPVLRVLADRKPLPARLLILGSASPDLIRKSSETLAGRIELLELTPFTMQEVSASKFEKHLLRGGFPLSFLARSDGDSFIWRKNFIQTFIERDIPQMGLGATPALLYRFWAMLAHYHGNIWNAAEMGRSLGVNETTARRYLDLLSGVYMVRQLRPWHANLGKRQVKSPKVYFRDSGLLHSLLGVESYRDLRNHPKSGASFEGYVIEEILRTVPHSEAYFWATHTGAELDLMLLQKKRRIGFEVKTSDAPKLTPSMRIAMEDLGLDSLNVIYPGRKAYALAKNIRVIPFPDGIIES
jgi:hypothetical protein